MLPGLLAPLLISGLLAGAEALVPTVPRLLALPPAAQPPSRSPVELRLEGGGSLYPVPAGLELPLHIEGGLEEPATDPGRTLLRLRLEAPILDARTRALLLPVGTRLVGTVHLLRGEYRFVAFQSLTLPDGRSLAAPDEAFRLGPGHSLVVREGGRATLILVRPLKMEAFGLSRVSEHP